MSYEKVNPILKGLKIDEAGIRDLKEIISQIDSKLNEIESEDILKDILKYVTNKVENPEVKIYKYMYKLPLPPRNSARESFLDYMYEINGSLFTGIGKLLNMSTNEREIHTKLSLDANCKELESDYGSPFKYYDCLLLYDIVTLKDINIADKDKKNIIKFIESTFKKKIPDFYRNKRIKREITTNKRDNETVFVAKFYLPVSWS